MSSHEIIGAIFRWINFFFLVGLGFYLFRKYALNKIKDTMKEEAHQKEQLYNEAEQCRHNKEDLQEEMEQQHKLYEKLQAKLQLWNQYYAELFNKRNHEKNYIKEIVEKKRQQERISLDQLYIKNEIMQHALEQARVELYKKYQDDDAGNRYNNLIISKLKKSAS